MSLLRASCLDIVFLRNGCFLGYDLFRFFLFDLFGFPARTHVRYVPGPPPPITSSLVLKVKCNTIFLSLPGFFLSGGVGPFFFPFLFISFFRLCYYFCAVFFFRPYFRFLGFTLRFFVPADRLGCFDACTLSVSLAPRRDLS